MSQQSMNVVVPPEREAQQYTPKTGKLLEFIDVRYKYHFENQEVLKGLSFSLDPGTMVLILGPTGCGKTTTVLAMNGLVPSSTGGAIEGEVFVEGKSTKKFSTAQLADTIGVVFQDPEGQMCTLFLEDEIAFGLENLQVDPVEISRRIEEMLEFIGLKGQNHKLLFELSGGQKQKVNFASVLATNPKLVVADMPTANLDPVGSEEVLMVLRDLVKSRQATCVVVENRVDELSQMADRIIVMGDGCILYDGSPAEVFGKYGKILRDEVGVDIPQVVEIALAMRDAGHNIGMPLTVENAAEGISRLHGEGKIQVLSPRKPEERPELATENQAIITAQDISFCYPSGTKALANVSFEMKKGETLAIIGNNGSGKTTLAKLIVGLLRPTSGCMEICGLDTCKVNVREIANKASYIFQYPDQQFVTQQVYDEIAFNLRNKGLPEEEIKQKVEEIQDRFKLRELSEKSPFMLSGGEMRTLSVACMLTIDPEIVILDEPTYGQDQAHVKALMAQLDAQKEKGTSIIIISHDMQLVAKYAQHVLVMNNSKLVFDGHPHDLFYQTDLLKQAKLKDPPVCRLVTKLSEFGINLPKNIITVDEFMKSFRSPAQSSTGRPK